MIENTHHKSKIKWKAFIQELFAQQIYKNIKNALHINNVVNYKPFTNLKWTKVLFFFFLGWPRNQTKPIRPTNRMMMLHWLNWLMIQIDKFINWTSVSGKQSHLPTVHHKIVTDFSRELDHMVRLSGALLKARVWVGWISLNPSNNEIFTQYSSAGFFWDFSHCIK